MTADQPPQDAAPPAEIPAVTHTFTAENLGEYYDLFWRSRFDRDPGVLAAKKSFRTYLAVGVLGAVGVVLGAATNTMGMGDINDRPVITVALAAGVVGAFWSAHQAWIPLSRKGRQAAREAYIRAGMAAGSGPTRFAIEESGIRISTAKNDTLYRWAGIADIRAEPGGILIDLGDDHTTYIPATAFATPAELQAFAAAAAAPLNASGHGLDTRLRRHLAHYDTPCPRCGYNLRGVTTRTCPECSEELTESLLTTRRAP